MFFKSNLKITNPLFDQSSLAEKVLQDAAKEKEWDTILEFQDVNFNNVFLKQDSKSKYIRITGYRIDQAKELALALKLELYSQNLEMKMSVFQKPADRSPYFTLKCASTKVSRKPPALSGEIPYILDCEFPQ